MERMQDKAQGLMDAWMASGGTVMASNAVKPMDDDAVLSAAGLTWNPNAPQCIESESADSALSAAAATSAAFGCPVF
tara:strand:- start:158 stop:388 length:231 start_codon:yes stop_codon:yes gene_type:complete